MKKVTIIVPVYNVEQYLERCVESLRNQTYSNIEIILVNDGATDTSPEICDQFSEKDSRVKVIHKKNGGLSDARNAGLKEVSGDYILFIDSDDYAEHNLVEVVLNSATSNNADVLVYGYFTDFVSPDESLLNSIPVVPGDGHFQSGNFSEIKIDNTLINLLGYAWNKLYKAEIILDNDFEFTKGISLVEDILFNVPVLKVANNISFLDKSLTHYIQRDRDTLGKKLYSNYGELKLMSAEAIKELLLHWGKEESEVYQIYNLLIFNSIKNLLATLGSNKQLSTKEKEAYMSSVIANNHLRSIIERLEVDSRKDKFIKNRVLNQKYSFLIKLYQIQNKISESRD